MCSNPGVDVAAMAALAAQRSVQALIASGQRLRNRSTATPAATFFRSAPKSHSPVSRADGSPQQCSKSLQASDPSSKPLQRSTAGLLGDAVAAERPRGRQQSRGRTVEPADRKVPVPKGASPASPARIAAMSAIANLERALAAATLRATSVEKRLAEVEAARMIEGTRAIEAERRLEEARHEVLQLREVVRKLQPPENCISQDGSLPTHQVVNKESGRQGRGRVHVVCEGTNNTATCPSGPKARATRSSKNQDQPIVGAGSFGAPSSLPQAFLTQRSGHGSGSAQGVVATPPPKVPARGKSRSRSRSVSASKQGAMIATCSAVPKQWGCGRSPSPGARAIGKTPVVMEWRDVDARAPSTPPGSVVSTQTPAPEEKRYRRRSKSPASPRRSVGTPVPPSPDVTPCQQARSPLQTCPTWDASARGRSSKLSGMSVDLAQQKATLTAITQAAMEEASLRKHKMHATQPQRSTQSSRSRSQRQSKSPCSDSAHVHSPGDRFGNSSSRGVTVKSKGSGSLLADTTRSASGIGVDRDVQPLLPKVQSRGRSRSPKVAASSKALSGTMHCTRDVAVGVAEHQDVCRFQPAAPKPTGIETSLRSAPHGHRRRSFGGGSAAVSVVAETVLACLGSAPRAA